MFIAMLVLTAGVASVGTVVAQDNPPGEPQSFYGSVADETGTPAPEGVEVFALIDGSVEDSIEVTTAGEYGGPETFDDKLAVNTGAGAEVTFRLNSPTGPEALESPYDLSNAENSVEELNLTFSEGAFETNPAAFEVTIDESASTLNADAGDQLGFVRREVGQLGVGLGGGLLEHGEGAHDLDRHALLGTADLEVLQRALGLRAPVAVGGHLNLAEGVLLDPHLGHADHDTARPPSRCSSAGATPSRQNVQLWPAERST